MDYLLLAATALGAIGLYLMLPRERAPLVRLGGLLGAMALAGLFLFLVRAAGGSSHAMNGMVAGNSGANVSEGRPPVYFYLFAAIMIAGAVGVVCQPRPVYAALYFVLVTLAGAGLFVLLLAEFMAIVLIIIYAGAILVTYVFVIMLASQGSAGGGTGGQVVAPAYDRRASSPLPAIVVAFVLVGAVLQALLPSNGRTIATPSGNPDHMSAIQTMMVRSLASDSSAALATMPAPAGMEHPTNVQLIGISLYSQYSLSLELAGILLTVALVGAVVIARKGAAPENEPLATGRLPAE